MKDLETMQREGRDGFRQDFTSDCEGYIDCIKGQLDKLDQHTASTWEACKDAILESGLLERKQAALVVEEMMEDEEHWKPITNRILDNTPPNKV